MLRFLLALLSVGGLWLAYELTAGSVDAGSVGAGSVSASPESAGDSTLALVQPSKASSPTPARLQAPAAPSPNEDGAVALEIEPSVPAVVASAQTRAARNDFLHSPAGRQKALAAIDEAGKQSPEEAVVAFTKLIEACMRGPIRKTDNEARAVVDAAWAAMQRPLRQTVLNPANTARARSYKVAPGDVLERIARRFREKGLLLDAGTIAALNRIDDPRRLRAGQVLKIPVEPIVTVVEKESFLAAMYVGDVIFRLYWVGHGREDRTPETTFTVSVKQEDPDWYAPDGRVLPYGHPDNVLGDYFVKFKHTAFTGFGAHGTSEPATIGTMASAGCLRMADGDIADFFNVVPRGTKVIIRTSR